MFNILPGMVEAVFSAAFVVVDEFGRTDDDEVDRADGILELASVNDAILDFGLISKDSKVAFDIIGLLVDRG